MSDIDQRIREALQKSGATDTAGEPNMAEELIETFRTRHRWLHVMAVVFIFSLLAVAVWSGWRFALADATRDQLLWGAACLAAFVSTGFLKIYFWMEIHTNRILRELKRVELHFIQGRR